MNKHNFWVVLMTLLIALLLSILPLPDFANWARPLWVMMVLCYWTIALEYRIGMGLINDYGRAEFPVFIDDLFISRYD
jgi:rod shape-determining protein MreD